MEKREERRKELLQRINEKKESPEAPPKPEPVKQSTKQQVQSTATKIKSQTMKTAAQTKPALQQSKSTPKMLATRRKRNRSGPVPRRRASSGTATTASEPASEAASEAEVDENSNQTCIETSSRIPAPAEVGSTATGTLSSDTSFRCPKTKKVEYIGVLVSVTGYLPTNQLICAE